jgi:SPP1 gp7 family putative phage head morphogenesis protein
MSYELFDSRGSVGFGPSSSELDALHAWAETTGKDVLIDFLNDGETRRTRMLATVLATLDVPEGLEDLHEELIRAATKAKDILILSDGMEGDELRTAEAAPKEFEIHGVADRGERVLESSVRFAFLRAKQVIPVDQLRAATSDIQAWALLNPAILELERELSLLLPGQLQRIAEQSAKQTLRTDLRPDRLRAAAGGAPDGVDPTITGASNVPPGLTGAADLELRALGPLKIRFTADRPEMVEAARQHAAKLITEISRTTRKRVREAIVDVLESGGGFDELYEEVLDAIGDASRAQTIARTEAMSAANRGQRDAWEAAQDEGLLPPGMRRVWIATSDACPSCEATDGETAPLHGTYPNGSEGPPLHPNCRCTEGITE